MALHETTCTEANFWNYTVSQNEENRFLMGNVINGINQILSFLTKYIGNIH